MYVITPVITSAIGGSRHLDDRLVEDDL